MARIEGISGLLASAALLVPMVMAATAMPAGAQTTAATEQAAADDTVGDVVVTARKRGETIVNVPVSITALSADALEARGIRDFNTLNDFVPGLRYENSAANRNDRSFHTYTMRGMYPGDSPNRQAVTVFLDGVPLPGGAIPGLTDVQRVEVVKGPQSAYFGRSTFAGAINFITAPPSLTQVKGSAGFSYASYNDLDATVSVEGPIITDKLAIRLSGRYYNTDGQYANAGFTGRLGARKTRSLAVSVIAKPVDDLTIRGYYTAWADSDGPSAQGLLTEANYNCNVGGTARTVGGLNYVCGGIGSVPYAQMSQNIAPGGNTNFTNLTGTASIVPADFIDHLGLERREYIANVSADYDLGNYVISGSFGKSHNQWAAMTDTYDRAPDGTGYFSAVYLPYNINNVSSELRVATAGNGPFKAMLGGNFYHESIKFGVRAFRPSTGNTVISVLSQPTDYRATTYGIFGSASYDFTDSLSVSGEARYQWDTINHIIPVSAVDLKATFKSFSPRVIVNYKITPSVNIYASYSKGTRPGTFNSNFLSFNAFQQAQIIANAGAGGVPTAVPEEKLTSWEVGLKGEFFDRKLRVLAATYYSLWRNRQINQNIAYLATPTSTTTSTATLTFPNGSTNLYGLELETTFKPVSSLTFEGTFNWAKTDIRFTQCAECVSVNGIANPVGNLMERYPEFSGSASATFEQPISDSWKAYTRADYIYTGIQYATEANVAYLKASNRVNLSVGIESDRYKLELFGRNIFDDKTPSNILRNANPNSSVAQGSNLIVLAAPERATIGIRGSAKF